MTRPTIRSRERSERLAKDGGEGGIRTHVPLTGQDAFEAPPLRPLRYLSVEESQAKRTFNYSPLAAASFRHHGVPKFVNGPPSTEMRISTL